MGLWGSLQLMIAETCFFLFFLCFVNKHRLVRAQINLYYFQEVKGAGSPMIEYSQSDKNPSGSAL